MADRLFDLMPINHAYAHWIGKIVGISGEKPGTIVAATVMTPEPGQDHNYLLVTVMAEDGHVEWKMVRAMQTVRKDFINS